jgi:hypothetical protein
MWGVETVGGIAPKGRQGKRRTRRTAHARARRSTPYTRSYWVGGVVDELARAADACGVAGNGNSGRDSTLGLTRKRVNAPYRARLRTSFYSVHSTI